MSGLHGLARSSNQAHSQPACRIQYSVCRFCSYHPPLQVRELLGEKDALLDRIAGLQERLGRWDKTEAWLEICGKEGCGATPSAFTRLPA